jgi:hypothetical protein
VLQSGGSYNVAIGASAGTAITTGAQNTAIGDVALTANTTASNNVAVGSVAMNVNTTGGNNVAVGTEALRQNTTASNNTAVGYKAGYSLTTASYNVAIGYQALYSNTTSYGENVAIGDSALYNTTDGWENIAIGRGAGESNTTGIRNTFIGDGAGNYCTTADNNTIIGRFTGNNGGLDIRTSSNNIVLSDGDGNPRMRFDSSGAYYVGKINENATTAGWQFKASGEAIVGRVANDTIFIFQNSSSGGTVGSISITGSSTSYNTSSDYRLKENVVYDWDATTRLKQLKPARFNFIADADTTVDGFLAHEAQEIVPECVTGAKDAVDADGVAVMQGIDQSKLVPLLVKTIQELEARITALEGA